MPGISLLRTALTAVLALALCCVGAPFGTSAQEQQPTLQDIAARDGLIAAQESLLNAYRCRFDIDTIVVPGGCTNGAPAVASDPAPPFAGPASWSELTRRDQLVLSQESLLNTYRCRFNIDTEVVPGGCTDGRPSSLPARPPSCDFAEHAASAVDAVWQVQAGQSLGTAFHMGSAADRAWWLTAEHVVRGSQTVVLTHSGARRSARVVTADRAGDIAVLSTAIGPEPALEFGGLSSAAPGSAVYLVGYPLYAASTPAVSRGIVSRLLDDPALGRVLQTDTSASPGNSGGPMLNACGKVAGMVVSKASAQGAEGINYSITEQALEAALAEAQADPDQEPAAPAPAKPELGEGAPDRGEWQQSQYDDGNDYLWYIAYKDENSGGAIVYEFPCSEDYWSIAFWTSEWSAGAFLGRGYIRIWNDTAPNQAILYRANLTQHFADGTSRFVLRQEFADSSSDSLSASYRLYVELLDVRQVRGALLTAARSAESDRELQEARNRTRRTVSC